MVNDESDDDGSVCESPGKCSFPCFYDESVGSVGESVGCVLGVGSVVSVPTVIESIGEVVLLVVFVPIGVKSKGGLLIIYFAAQNLDFPS